MDTVIVQLFQLSPDVPVPQYGTLMSACFDLSYQPCGRFSVQGYDRWNNPCDRMTYGNQLSLFPQDRILVPTGLIMKIKSSGLGAPNSIANYSIRLHARSGLSLKKGLVLANAEGVIDVDYQQEIFVMLTNISEVPVTINVGERVAQAEIVHNVTALFELVKEQPQPLSTRDGGFGSTGHS
jgi:dUTP pyrophosphatase